MCDVLLCGAIFLTNKSHFNLLYFVMSWHFKMQEGFFNLNCHFRLSNALKINLKQCQTSVICVVNIFGVWMFLVFSVYWLSSGVKSHTLNLCKCTSESFLTAVNYRLCSLFIPSQDSGLNLLMVAVRESRLSIVDRLLELGINLNDKTKVWSLLQSSNTEENTPDMSRHTDVVH